MDSKHRERRFKKPTFVETKSFWYSLSQFDTNKWKINLDVKTAVFRRYILPYLICIQQFVNDLCLGIFIDLKRHRDKPQIMCKITFI